MIMNSLFIDNDSSDQTRPILREICKNNEHIKAIFNAKNFGQFNSPYYGMLQTTGDCTISMVCDFQDPVELIPQYLEAWEQGYKIVIGIKTSSKENPIMYHLRSVYYKMIKKFSDVEQIEHFTGSGLYDKDFIQVLRDLKDPTPFPVGLWQNLDIRGKRFLMNSRKEEQERHIIISCGYMMQQCLALLLIQRLA